MTHLEYDAYPEMAEAEMQRIAEAVRARHDVLHVAMAHRTGHVPLGEASVIIAVSAAHRGAAMDACREAIDTLKQTVPIWKKEVFEGGEEWIGREGDVTCRAHGHARGQRYSESMTYDPWEPREAPDRNALAAARRDPPFQSPVQEHRGLLRRAGGGPSRPGLLALKLIGNLAFLFKFKFLLSFLISAALYTWAWGWQFGVGFVLLLLDPRDGTRDPAQAGGDRRLRADVRARSSARWSR